MRLDKLDCMKRLSEIPESEREHFIQCSVCESYFDMRDLGAVVDHEHWLAPVETSFSHSKKLGKEGEVYVRGRQRMVTLREKKKQAQNDLRRQA